MRGIRRCFFDTNVIVYAHDDSEPKKRDRARELLGSAVQDGSGVISAQVLSETYVTLTKKLGIAAIDVEDEILQLSEFRVVEISAALVLRALQIKEEFELSYWDSLIIAAAEHAGCGTVWSEDLNDGQAYGRVIVRNPFKQRNS